jgi:hypothetical protein
MIDVFKYLYYRLYSWNLKTWGESDFPQWNALYGVSFMMFLNLNLLGLILQFFDINIFLRNELPIKELVFIMLCIIIINYFLFIHKGNFRIMVKELKNESLERRRKNTILIWLYVIISFSLVVLFALIIKKFKGY